jgi:ketosteroid isomerase-like protein
MTPLETVRSIYVAFSNGEMDVVRDLMDEEIVWIEPDGYFVPEGRGKTVGRDNVMGIFAKYFDYWEKFTVTADEIFESTEGAVFVLGRQHARALGSGKGFEGGFANLWLVEDGKLIKHVSFSDTLSMAKALGKV